MERQFMKLVSNKNVDLIPYIKEYMKQHESIDILIGCDSQNRGAETKYAVVVGLYTPKKGAHVLYSKFSTKREPENVTRLLNEVWFSVETAELIRSELGLIAKWIDIDLNPDPKYQSNKALTSAIGIVVGMGYHVRHKGNSPIMTYASDKIVK